MATLQTGSRNAACDAVVDLIDAGTPPGKLIFATSGDVTVAALTFSNTAFSSAGSQTVGVATAASITSDTNAAGGTIAKCRIQNAAAGTVMAVTVGTSGQEINLSSLAITAGDTVAVSALTVTMPA